MKKWSEMTDEEINAFKRKTCAKCFYFGKSSAKYISMKTCEYSDKHGHSRGCSPLECVEKGIFTPIKNKRNNK